MTSDEDNEADGLFEQPVKSHINKNP